MSQKQFEMMIEMIQDNLKDFKKDITKQLDELRNLVLDHMKGDCSTQKELTEFKINAENKFSVQWKYIIGIPILTGSITGGIIAIIKALS